MYIEKLTRRVDDLALSTIKKEPCSHPAFTERVCIRCGQKADNDNTIASIYGFSVPFRYICTKLRLSKDEIARLKDKNTKKTLSRRKLHLVLDLDHTLIHSIFPQDMKPRERYFWKSIYQPRDGPRGETPYVGSDGIVTKFRPFVQTFLKEASTMFVMSIYTMGNRAYAKDMTRLLDPRGVYFSHVVASEDCTRAEVKGLDVILAKESTILILDDTESVWPDHKENLIRIGRYFYSFPGFHWGKSPAHRNKSGENESDGALASVLEVLKKVHTRFFEEHDQAKNLEIDLRDVLKTVRGV